MVKNHSSRFLGFVFVFMFILVAYHILSDLPHKNTKYYYIFGVLFAILLSVSDFFHRMEITSDFKALGSSSSASLAAMKYQKWSLVLQFSLGILAVVLGTISFSLLGYIRTIFGESFVFYPLLGILVSMSYLTLIYYFGIIRNIILILDELEQYMAKQTTPPLK